MKIHLLSKVLTFGALWITLAPVNALAQVSLWAESTNGTEQIPIPNAIYIDINTQTLLSLSKGDDVQITLEPGETRLMTIDTTSLVGDTFEAIGRLKSGEGSLLSIKYDGSIIGGSVLINADGIGYEIEGSSSAAVLIKKTLDEFICTGIPIPKPGEELAEYSAAVGLGASETSVLQSSVPVYNSNPGASRVIYLDFDGQIVSGTTWNSTYNGGAAIDAQPFDQDGNPNTFNVDEVAFIKGTWEQTKDAFSIYQVNVTTSQSVYNSVAVNRRQRVVLTPTDAWIADTNPGGGGWGRIGSFGTSNPAWGFTKYYSTGRSMGLASAHEAGHTLGLRHDGLLTQNNTEYHYGQNRGWGPFMGAPYRSSYATWSKGDYSGATQFQNDLYEISRYIPYKGDTVGNANASASVASDGYLVSRVIGASNDKDVYKIFIESGERIVAQSAVTGAFPTLNSKIELYAANGQLVAQNDQVQENPLPRYADKSLDSGINYVAQQRGYHYLHVRGNGYNGGANYNFSSYGAVGQYSLSISVGGINIVPVLYLLLLDDEQ